MCSAPSVEIVGIDAEPVLQAARAEVVAVWRRSFYLRAGSALACFGGEEIGCAPLNVILHSPAASFGAQDWRIHLQPGCFVRFGENSAQRCDAQQSDEPTFALAGMQIWRPPPLPRWSKVSLAEGLRHFERELAAWPVPQDGLGYAAWQSAPVSGLVAQAAAPHIAALRRCAAEGCPLECIPDVTGLLGLGPGLTPSGDDLLGGFLAVLRAVDQRVAADALWGPLQLELSRTNSISAAHLTAAAAGRLSAKHHTLLNALLSGMPAEIGGAVRAIMESEHTSSRDALAGMSIGLHAIYA